MTYHYKDLRVIVKDLCEYFRRSPYGCHLIEPNQFELDAAVEKAKAEKISIIHVYLG